MLRYTPEAVPHALDLIARRLLPRARFVRAYNLNLVLRSGVGPRGSSDGVSKLTFVDIGAARKRLRRRSPRDAA